MRVMGAAPHTPRLWLVLIVAAGAMLALVGFVLLLPAVVGRQQPAAPARTTVTRVEVQAALDRAAAALRAGDRPAFLAALPAASPGARDGVAALYDHLEPLPWTGFTMRALPGPVAGTYRVFAAGQLGGAGPADRVGGERLLAFRRSGARIFVAADRTPEMMRREYLMWMRRPFVVQRSGLVVVADRSSRRRALLVAADGVPARARLAAALGMRPPAPIFVSVYSTMVDLRASLGGGPSETRIRFFSNAGPRLDGHPYHLRDVGVLGPSLDGKGSWLPLMLAHELTHAYTAQWFLGTRHAPTFLLEGLAMAVERGRDWAPLREEVATGNQLWPLPKAFGTEDLWRGNSTAQVRLGYLEAGSVVLYVARRWGLNRVKPFAVAVADSDLTRAGVEAAVRRRLGVSWADFYAGWRRYVLALP